MKTRHYRMNLDRLRLVVKRLGYLILFETEYQLGVRNFPYHFEFTQKSDHTDVYGHLDQKTITGGHVKSHCHGNEQKMKREYHHILTVYNLRK